MSWIVKPYIVICSAPLFSGATTRQFVGHNKDVLSVAFSADNRQIVSGSRDKTIKLWNTLGVCKYTIQVSDQLVLRVARSLSRICMNWRFTKHILNLEQSAETSGGILVVLLNKKLK